MRSGTDRKICGTCQHWTGNREPVFDKNGRPKVDIFDMKGECMCVHSKFDGQMRKRDLNCVRYSKWTELL